MLNSDLGEHLACLSLFDPPWWQVVLYLLELASLQTASLLGLLLLNDLINLFIQFGILLLAVERLVLLSLMVQVLKFHRQVRLADILMELRGPS